MRLQKGYCPTRAHNRKLAGSGVLFLSLACCQATQDLVRHPSARLHQQSPPRHVQIRQPTADLEPVGVFRQPTIANFGPSKNSLDHQERLFDLRPDLRLRTVAGSLLLTQRPMAMRFRLNEARSVRRVLRDDVALPAIRRIAPHPRLLAIPPRNYTILLIVVPMSKRPLFSVVKSACVPQNSNCGSPHLLVKRNSKQFPSCMRAFLFVPDLSAG